MNPHQRCLQAKVKYRNEPKQVMPKSEYLSRSLEINAIWTFDTEFPTIFNKSCTYITFKSAVKHRQYKDCVFMKLKYKTNKCYPTKEILGHGESWIFKKNFF